MKEREGDGNESRGRDEDKNKVDGSRRNVDERNAGRKTKPVLPLENRENVGIGNL